MKMHVDCFILDHYLEFRRERERLKVKGPKAIHHKEVTVTLQNGFLMPPVGINFLNANPL